MTLREQIEKNKIRIVVSGMVIVLFLTIVDVLLRIF